MFENSVKNRIQGMNQYGVGMPFCGLSAPTQLWCSCGGAGGRS